MGPYSTPYLWASLSRVLALKHVMTHRIVAPGSLSAWPVAKLQTFAQGAARPRTMKTLIALGIHHALASSGAEGQWIFSGGAARCNLGGT